MQVNSRAHYKSDRSQSNWSTAEGMPVLHLRAWRWEGTSKPGLSHPCPHHIVCVQCGGRMCMPVCACVPICWLLGNAFACLDKLRLLAMSSRAYF